MLECLKEICECLKTYMDWTRVAVRLSKPVFEFHNRTKLKWENNTYLFYDCQLNCSFWNLSATFFARIFSICIPNAIRQNSRRCHFHWFRKFQFSTKSATIQWLNWTFTWFNSHENSAKSCWFNQNNAQIRIRHLEFTAQAIRYFL